MDHAGDGGPLSVFWEAVHGIDPDAEDESQLAGAREGHLGQLCRDAGLRDVEDGALVIEVEHDVRRLVEPYLLGSGPAGAYVARLELSSARDELRERCRALLPDPPFVVEARAWAARGRV